MNTEQTKWVNHLKNFTALIADMKAEQLLADGYSKAINAISMHLKKQVGTVMGVPE